MSLNKHYKPLVEMLDEILYDVFAYRLGPEEWEFSRHDFFAELAKRIVSDDLEIRIG